MLSQNKEVEIAELVEDEVFAVQKPVLEVERKLLHYVRAPNDLHPRRISNNKWIRGLYVCGDILFDALTCWSPLTTKTAGCVRLCYQSWTNEINNIPQLQRFVLLCASDAVESV